jgi:hypothetical protein
MPDTGAPWNIPYVDNADLVRDWPADSLLVANAVAAGLTASGAAVKQIVSASDATNQTTTSSSFVDVSGVTLSITPGSVTSKIIVICSLSSYSQRTSENSTDSYFQLSDGSDVAVPGAEGLRVGAANVTRVGSSFTIYAPVTLFGIAEPATTSAVTYKARFRRGQTLAGILGATNTSKIYAIEVDL